MKKPPQIVLDLAAMWPITTLQVKHRYSMEKELTRVVLTGRDLKAKMEVGGVGLSGQGQKTVEYAWADILPYVEVGVDHVSVLRVKPHLLEGVRAWNDLMKEEAAEYAEFQRLKAKYDGDTALQPQGV